MTILLLAIIALGIITAIFGLLSHNKSGGESVIVRGTDCSSCSGDNPKCEQECMMEAATKPVEYFDDEELDDFAQRPSDQYSDDEAEQFREVLYTMQPSEVRDWTHSLTLRNINLPDQVKDEVFVLLNEE